MRKSLKVCGCCTGNKDREPEELKQRKGEITWTKRQNATWRRTEMGQKKEEEGLTKKQGDISDSKSKFCCPSVADCLCLCWPVQMSKCSEEILTSEAQCPDKETVTCKEPGPSGAPCQDLRWKENSCTCLVQEDMSQRTGSPADPSGAPLPCCHGTVRGGYFPQSGQEESWSILDFYEPDETLYVELWDPGLEGGDQQYEARWKLSSRGKVVAKGIWNPVPHVREETQPAVS
nr:PREDICTED: uncharacterized protein LOC107078637 [Lepisosteus oculatus]